LRGSYVLVTAGIGLGMLFGGLLPVTSLIMRLLGLIVRNRELYGIRIY